jgi:hypothetical protein
LDAAVIQTTTFRIKFIVLRYCCRVLFVLKSFTKEDLDEFDLRKVGE